MLAEARPHTGAQFYPLERLDRSGLERIARVVNGKVIEGADISIPSSLYGRGNEKVRELRLIRRGHLSVALFAFNDFGITFRDGQDVPATGLENSILRFDTEHGEDKGVVFVRGRNQGASHTYSSLGFSIERPGAYTVRGGLEAVIDPEKPNADLIKEAARLSALYYDLSRDERKAFAKTLT